MEEVIIVGAGPCGLSAAVELEKIGIRPLLLEKNCLVHSIYQYPVNLQFFSTPQLLEIGDIPFTTPNEKPMRQEALTYYRNVAQHYKLRIHSYEAVTNIVKEDGCFRLHTADSFDQRREYEARYVIMATGYFDHPNMIGIPGEELPKVSHYYREAHPYTGMKVAVIGGNNSAVDAAMELQRVGADVTVIYRGRAYSPNVKPWVQPNFESMVNKGRIRMLFNSSVIRIDSNSVTVNTADGELVLENDFVLALTGFRPDRKFLQEIGVRLQGDYGIPVHNPITMETDVEGLYIAGVIASGADANEIFIETGRKHGLWIAQHIADKEGAR
ncbi:MAG: FAD-dependent disulfide oxidoreductase-like protein [Paenibacillus sp.]|jgi:thioredoxin reductase (NADPH)|nr:FAD-dependent disulfide oxidoreductase-like protein [Paenibacillus sp.]